MGDFPNDPILKWGLSKLSGGLSTEVGVFPTEVLVIPTEMRDIPAVWVVSAEVFFSILKWGSFLLRFFA